MKEGIALMEDLIDLRDALDRVTKRRKKTPILDEKLNAKGKPKLRASRRSAS